jgi:sterol 3beta-glucosyltransferase
MARVSLVRLREALKPIVFLTSGTRGDIQPVAALAFGLQTAGVRVRVAAPPAYRDLVEGQSLPFIPLDGNPSELLTRPGAQSALTFNDFPLRGLRSMLDYIRAAQPVYAQMIKNGWEASTDASALVVGLPTLWGKSIAQALRIPCIGAFLQPLSATREFPSPLLPAQLKLGSAYNRLTYRLIAQSIHLPWRGVVNEWRREYLGLGPLPGLYDYFDQMDSILYGFSSRVVPRPREWKDTIAITGYWQIPERNYQPPQDLLNFLRSGPQPYFIGFGSPGMHDPAALTALLVKVIEGTGLRVVLSLPAGFDADPAHSFPPNLFLLRTEVPHDWLFPRMAGIVHHGGAGTTAATLRAGVPMLITPLAADQFFWGERIHALGLGPRPMPQRKLTADFMERAFMEMQGEEMKENAARLGEGIRAEDGVAEAVSWIETFLRSGRSPKPDLVRRWGS